MEEPESDENDFDGIPAPLLVGGAYRVDQENSNLLKKRLELEDSSRKRMHLKKIKKRKIFDG